tara:strand:+ start:3796 stop:4623 length:828 start_codon:yes stop_codon:yes gene_type:complete
MKSLKTPLRYPGGKSRVAPMLVDKMPRMTEYREPFLGGGSTAIEFTKKYRDIPVWVNDLYVPLYNFWTILQEDSDTLSDALMGLKINHDTPEKARELYHSAKTRVNDPDIFLSAVYFWVMNKCSYSGLTENSSFSPQASVQNFTKKGIKNLPYYGELIQDWKITNLDYNSCFGGDAFLFLDPPYDIKDFLYGGKGGTMHKGFDHRQFAYNCAETTNKWMITYNINENIEELFKSYNIEKYSITYGMQHREDNTRKKELLITNYSIKSPLEELFVD